MLLVVDSSFNKPIDFPLSNTSSCILSTSESAIEAKVSNGRNNLSILDFRRCFELFYFEELFSFSACLRAVFLEQLSSSLG